MRAVPGASGHGISSTTVALLSVVVAAIVLGALVVIVAPSIPTSSVLGSSTVTTTASVSPGAVALNETVRTNCYIMGQPIGAGVQILSDGGSPISGVNVTAHVVGNQCGGFDVSTPLTNSSGWVKLPGKPGAYNLTFSYFGNQYNVGVPMYPVSLTVIRVQVPSGFWTVDVRTYGGYPGEPIAGDLISARNGTTPFQLKISLGSSSVKVGQFLPIKVSFIGAGASSTSYRWVTVVATNSQGLVVSNFSQRQDNLFFLGGTTAAGLLRGFSSDDGWNATPHPPEFTVPVTPGTYTVTVVSTVDGRTLTASDVVQVIP